MWWSMLQKPAVFAANRSGIDGSSTGLTFVKAAEGVAETSKVGGGPTGSRV